MSRAPQNQPDACIHSWTYREVNNETWNVCVRCGFGEQWQGGVRFKTTDEVESQRLDALSPRHGNTT